MITVEVLKEVVDKQVEQIQNSLEGADHSESVNVDGYAYTLIELEAMHKLTAIEELVIGLAIQLEDADLEKQVLETKKGALKLNLHLRSKELQGL